MSDTQPGTNVPPTEERPYSPWNNMPKWARVAAIALTGAVGIALVAGIAAPAFGPSKLAAATEECGVDDEAYVSLGDDDRSLFINGAPESGVGGLDYAGTACVLHVLDAPDSTISLIGQTRALDGRQVDDWDNVEASWTYHPEDGLDILFELR